MKEPCGSVFYGRPDILPVPFCKSAVGRQLSVARLADYSHNPQQHHGSDNRCDEASDDTSGRNTEKTEEPAAKHAADNAYHKVDYKAEATPAHKSAGDKASQYANQDEPDKTHNFQIFVFIKKRIRSNFSSCHSISAKKSRPAFVFSVCSFHKRYATVCYAFTLQFMTSVFPAGRRR